MAWRTPSDRAEVIDPSPPAPSPASRLPQRGGVIGSAILILAILRNRVALSLVLFLGGAFLWEFYIKPDKGPLYTAALVEYRAHRYARSLEMLRRAARIDPNDIGVLTLIGWSHLKLGDTGSAETNFRRAYKLSPRTPDLILGYAYTEIALKNYEQAAALLLRLGNSDADTADTHVAWGTIYREWGVNRRAAHEFRRALALRMDDPASLQNLRELYNLAGDPREARLDFPPLVRARDLTVPARVEGELFTWRNGRGWRPVYLKGVNLTSALPGHFPFASAPDDEIYSQWFRQLENLGANTIRVPTLMPPAFYRALGLWNQSPPRTPLHLLQGIALDDPPENDLLRRSYRDACQKEIHDTIDVLHGQGDVVATRRHPGGLYIHDVSAWVAGLLFDPAWTSHVIKGNDGSHPDTRSYRGSYIEVPAGTATEIFLALMIEEAVAYEESRYNWQHPVAFVNRLALDSIPQAAGSAWLKGGPAPAAPSVPVDIIPAASGDGVSLNPRHLRPRESFFAGYFTAYSVLPSCPDSLNPPRNQPRAHAIGGSDPFLGYLRDLKRRHRGLPLVISDYGAPPSLGIHPFSTAGFDEGSRTGRVLERGERPESQRTGAVAARGE